MDTPASMDASKLDLVPMGAARLLRFPSPPREMATRPERDAARAYLKETAEFCADAHDTLKQVRYPSPAYQTSIDPSECYGPH